MIETVYSSIFGALIVLGVIIVIHEAGHFLVAKFFGIRVETFSIGFGPRLFGFRRGETDYRISAFPLGGYVKMSGESPGDEVTGDPAEFMSKPKWQRFLVAFAGPAMNGVLAVILLAGLFMVGTEVQAVPDETRIGVVAAGSPAASAGLARDDLILEFDGKSDPTWQDIEIEVLMSPERAIPVRVERNGEVIETTLTPSRQFPNETGYSGMLPLEPVIVGDYTGPNSPAERAGLQPGDEIVAVGDTDLATSAQPIQDLVQSYPSEQVPLTVHRGDQVLYLDVEPEIDENGRRLIGFYFALPTEEIQLGFADAMGRSIRTNAAYGMMIFDLLGRIVRREASMRTLEGPIGIVNISGRAFEQGVAPLIQLMALISLNLGVINLFPIPILDGGVMLMLAIEGIMRQDLSVAVKERIVQVSFVFLLTLIVFVLYNDIVKLSN